MFITGTRPVKVNGFVLAYDYDDPEQRKTARRGDFASAIMLRMDNGAVCKLLQLGLRGEGIWVRIHGNRGLMENLRHGDKSMVRIVKEPWDREPDEPHEMIVKPDFGEHQAAIRAGHGGGDYFMNLEFAHAIRVGEPPVLDVYSGVSSRSSGSSPTGRPSRTGAPVDVPDFRNARRARRTRTTTGPPIPRTGGRASPSRACEATSVRPRRASPPRATSGAPRSCCTRTTSSRS